MGHISVQNIALRPINKLNALCQAGHLKHLVLSKVWLVKYGSYDTHHLTWPDLAILQ